MLSVVTTCNPDLRIMQDFIRSLSHEASRSGISIEMVIVNDLSVPGINKLSQHGTALTSVRTLNHLDRKGQLPATLDGIAVAAGDAILAMDPDMSTNIPDIHRFLEALRAGSDVVYGFRASRFDTSPSRRLASRIMGRLVATISGLPMHDPNSPMVMLSRAAALRIPETLTLGSSPKLWMPHLFSKSFTEIPISLHAPSGSASSYSLADLIRLSFSQLRDAYQFRRAVSRQRAHR